MVIMQLLLLKIALDHKPGPASKGGDAALPFAGAKEGIFERRRPYQFWQWRSPRPYVHAIILFWVVCVCKTTNNTGNALVTVIDTGNSCSTSSSS